ncbi:hypothetical protein L208DRAFT_1415148 [Tricholoma matsutake]|nr:hypothetical protein L208DRAFT_1415148 [Tricholoma matsutake 945]
MTPTTPPTPTSTPRTPPASMPLATLTMLTKPVLMPMPLVTPKPTLTMLTMPTKPELMPMAPASMPTSTPGPLSKTSSRYQNLPKIPEHPCIQSQICSLGATSKALSATPFF